MCFPYWWCTKHAQLWAPDRFTKKKTSYNWSKQQKSFHLIKYLLTTFISFLTFQSVLIAHWHWGSRRIRVKLTHWGWVTHICISIPTIIGSDNGLSPGRRHAIIWANAGILSIWPLGTNFIEILIEIHTFSVKKMHETCACFGNVLKWEIVIPIRCDYSKPWPGDLINALFIE